MTPGQIRQLLGIYALAEPELNPYFVMQLTDDGLVRHNADRSVTLTERGLKAVELLCSTPLPEHRWVDPRESVTNQ